MSDWKNPGFAGETQPSRSSVPVTTQGSTSGQKRWLVPQVKDVLMLVGWIAGLILIAALCWFLTQPVRSRFLRSAVNQVLEDSGDSRRLGEPDSPGMCGSIGMGTWYTMTELSTKPDGNTGRGEFSEGTKAYIFTFIGEGTFFPCAAVVTPGGKVQEFIPLNSHGVKMLKLISPGILRIYAQRIEGDKS